MICESCNNEFTQDASSPVGLCPACWDQYRRECVQCGEYYDGEHWSGTCGYCPECWKKQRDPYQPYTITDLAQINKPFEPC